MDKWYLYENEEVIGPLEVSELRGRVTESTLVCRAGEENWQEAGEVTELVEIFETPLHQNEQLSPEEHSTSSVQADDEEHSELEPTLYNLKRICEEASDETLLKEYRSFWSEYDDDEQFIIRKEMKRRDIWDELRV